MGVPNGQIPNRRTAESGSCLGIANLLAAAEATAAWLADQIDNNKGGLTASELGDMIREREYLERVVIPQFTNGTTPPSG